jgi:uncharacterized PurR-regulated membrane protein YhhQ (DUF165 family)
MEINRSRYRFNRRIVAVVLFVLLVLSYVVLTLVAVADPNQVHSEEQHHERQA